MLGESEKLGQSTAGSGARECCLCKCEWSCPRNTLTPRLSTRWLDHSKDTSCFQGWPALQPWASQADTSCPLLFLGAFFLCRKYLVRTLSVESQMSYWWFLQPRIPFQTHTFNFKDLSHNISEFWFWIEVAPWTSSKCLVPNKPFSIFPIFRRPWACTGCFNETNIF